MSDVSVEVTSEPAISVDVIPLGATGPMGPQGLEGPQGATGSTGADGEAPELRQDSGYVQWKLPSDVAWTNLIALSAITGPAGAAGSDGADGADGVNGADGREIELQAGATHIQWRYSGDVAWTDLVALSALQGPAGADGDPGADGSDGADGAPGTDGKTILNGAGSPAPELGVDGDFYIDVTTWEIYGPKTAGAWGDPTSLIGEGGSGEVPTLDEVLAAGNVANTPGASIKIDYEAAPGLSVHAQISAGLVKLYSVGLGLLDTYVQPGSIFWNTFGWTGVAELKPAAGVDGGDVWELPAGGGTLAVEGGVDLAIAPGSANNPHTDASAARNPDLPKNFWQTATEPENWLDGDEWIVTS